MKQFVPRHLRKRYVNKSGPGKDVKQKAFKRCARISKRFIHQSASVLESPRFATQYAEFCELTGKGMGFRKGG